MNHHSATLREWLESELSSMRALEKSLDAEYQALSGRDVEHLEAVTRRKNSALAEHRGGQQQGLARAAGLGLAAEASVSEMLNTLAEGGEFSELARELLNLARRCQDSNRRNGMLILRLQDQTRSALHILRGDAPGTELYSLSGAREHHVDGQSLGKA